MVLAGLSSFPFPCGGEGVICGELTVVFFSGRCVLRLVQVMYNELDQWRRVETKRVKQAEGGERRQLALRELLHKETRLLQTIDRLKITAAHEGKVCCTYRGDVIYLCFYMPLCSVRECRNRPCSFGLSLRYTLVLNSANACLPTGGRHVCHFTRRLCLPPRNVLTA